MSGCLLAVLLAVTPAGLLERAMDPALGVPTREQRISACALAGKLKLEYAARIYAGDGPDTAVALAWADCNDEGLFDERLVQDALRRAATPQERDAILDLALDGFNHDTVVAAVLAEPGTKLSRWALRLLRQQSGPAAELAPHVDLEGAPFEAWRAFVAAGLPDWAERAAEEFERQAGPVLAERLAVAIGPLRSPQQLASTPQRWRDALFGVAEPSDAVYLARVMLHLADGRVVAANDEAVHIRDATEHARARLRIGSYLANGYLEAAADALMADLVLVPDQLEPLWDDLEWATLPTLPRLSNLVAETLEPLQDHLAEECRRRDAGGWYHPAEIAAMEASLDKGITLLEWSIHREAAARLALRERDPRRRAWYLVHVIETFPDLVADALCDEEARADRDCRLIRLAALGRSERIEAAKHWLATMPAIDFAEAPILAGRAIGCEALADQALPIAAKLPAGAARSFLLSAAEALEWGERLHASSWLTL